jgi:hypothetical protein
MRAAETILWGLDMLPTTPIYVAETDEADQIDCVWYAASDQRAARPVQSPHKHLALLDQAHCSGASSHAICDWLEKNAGRGAAQ